MAQAAAITTFSQPSRRYRSDPDVKQVAGGREPALSLAAAVPHNTAAPALYERAPTLLGSGPTPWLTPEEAVPRKVTLWAPTGRGCEAAHG